MSYYKTIDGVNYDKDLLELAEALIEGKGDGRLSEDDMKQLIGKIIDKKKITKTEYLTMFYIIKKYNITQKGLESFAEGCASMLNLNS